MQPSEAATPIVSGDCVPWTAIRSSPFQVGGQVRLVGGEGDRAAAVGRARTAHLQLVGDGEAAGRRRVVGRADADRGALEHAVAVADRQRAGGAVDVQRDVRGAEPRAAGRDPAGPRVGRSGTTTCSHAPRRRSTLTTRGPPNCVRGPMPPTRAPARRRPQRDPPVSRAVAQRPRTSGAARAAGRRRAAGPALPAARRSRAAAAPRPAGSSGAARPPPRARARRPRRSRRARRAARAGRGASRPVSRFSARPGRACRAAPCA